MQKFLHSFFIPADIDSVWNFYTDIGHLEIITPHDMHLKVVKSSTGNKLREGTEVWIQGDLILRSTWHSKITLMTHYTYVDEMLEGRFRIWKHTHNFKRIASGTEVVDEIEFELRYGLVGKLLECYVCRQLEKIFTHRKTATLTALK